MELPWNEKAGQLQSAKTAGSGFRYGIFELIECRSGFQIIEEEN